MASNKRRKQDSEPPKRFEVLLSRDYDTLRLPALPDVERAAARSEPRDPATKSAPAAPAASTSPTTPAIPAPHAASAPRRRARSSIASEARLPVPAGAQPARLPAALGTGARLPALNSREPAPPIVIPGSGRPMGRSHIHGRSRPLAMRLTVLVLVVGIVASALITVAPLQDGSANAQASFPFEGITNAVVWHATPGYNWYTAAPGDTVESITRRFHCQIGGFYEMNGLLAGEEVQAGKAYKVPTDPYYGLYYRPPSYVFTGSGYGQTTYTDHIWSSEAGIPPLGAYCGPTPRGSGDNMYNYDLSSFDLKAPNWGAYWVRGFTWYHFGVDLANPMGTPIHAAQSGEVIFADWDTGGGGWSVKINHCNHLATAYGHMETLLVHVHQMVHAGDVIGLEGSTGWSTGPHLHFSVQWDNLAIDPMLFFGDSKYNITHFIQD